MDIKLITRHAPANYGSLLQSLAAVKTLESIGHSCTIVDYVPRAEQPLAKVRAEARAKEGWKNSRLKQAAYMALRLPAEAYAARKFEHFRRQMLPLTRRFDTNEGLSEMSAGIFATGSDQVWGPASGKDYDPTYFLDFTPDDARRVAWSASFGRIALAAPTAEAVKPLLSRYEHITVRENAAVGIVENLGLPTPPQTLDPTLMLSAGQWEEMRDDSRLPDKPYILVYQLHNNPAFDRYVLWASARTGLPIVRVSPSLHQIARPGRLIWLPKPGQFLSLIRNAKLMVTDSFHGTAFAILFHTRFVDILPVNGTSSRNLSLLELTGLASRIVDPTQPFVLPTSALDFTGADMALRRERLGSYEILKQMLQ